jgi:hypothetical protein
VNPYLEKLRAKSQTPSVREVPKLPKGDLALLAVPAPGTSAGLNGPDATAQTQPLNPSNTQMRVVRELPKPPKAPFGTFDSSSTKRIRENAAANDPALTRPQQPRPAVLRLPQHPGDAAEEALALLDQLHAWGVILTAEDGALTGHGLHTLPAELREEVAALIHPAVYGRDLLAAVQARDAAAAAIERAMPLQRCWGCRHLHTAQRGNPQCAKGHAVAWRQTGPGGMRTVPLRVSRRGPCTDRVERSDADRPNT